MPKEVYRPRRSEYAPPTTAVEMLERQNADRFIGAYLRQITAPRLLLNHVGTIQFVSEEDALQEREDGLAEYLYRAPPPPEQWIYGRTILAEVVSKEITQAMMGPTLEQSAMFVDYVPTSIDGSSWKGETPYQKGVDFILVQMQPLQGETVMAPICGFDVTVAGHPFFLEKKRERPGFQSEIAMPAAVVSLLDLKWGPEWDQTIFQYLDGNARRQVLETGTYTPFYGLDQAEREMWEQVLREEMLRSLSHCRASMEQTYRGFQSPLKYQHRGEVVDKIQQTKRLLRGTALPIPVEARVAPALAPLTD